MRIRVGSWEKSGYSQAGIVRTQVESWEQYRHRWGAGRSEDTGTELGEVGIMFGARRSADTYIQYRELEKCGHR